MPDSEVELMPNAGPEGAKVLGYKPRPGEEAGPKLADWLNAAGDVDGAVFDAIAGTDVGATL